MESLNRKSPTKNASILIVDDDLAAIEALRRILRRGGYANVLGVSEATGSLDAIERYKPSLVILDLHMPGMDGYAVLGHISRSYLPEEAPSVLVVTAAEDRPSRLRALEAGARDYLVKPYDPYEVLLRVRNLLELQHQRQMLASVLNATPIAMLGHDLDGNCTYINRGALDLLGHKIPEEMVGKNIRELVKQRRPADSKMRGDCPLMTMAGGEGESFCWRPDGTPVPVRYWAHSLDMGREDADVLVTLVDLTERCESERGLRLANTVFECVDQALMITDSQARIVAVNHAYTELTGWTMDEIVGQNPRLRRSGRQDTAFYREMWRCLLDEDGWQGELWNRRKDGNDYLEEVSITTVRDTEGAVTHFVAALRDMTEIRRHAQELEEARKTAEEANKAKSRFVANMSHEIRTPLTSIVGFAETLTDEEQPVEDWRHAVDAIIRNGHYLLELVEDILDFSKIEADRLAIERVKTSFVDLMRSVVVVGSARAHDKGLQFDVIIEPPWPATLMTDPTRTKQVLVNLLSNAVKFTERGSVRLRVSLDPERELLRCEVADTGIGIDEARLPELFESFVQADVSTVRKHGGSGLGLTIARTLARQLGGDLTVRSVRGVGSQFTATLATGSLSDVQLEQAVPDLSDDRLNVASNSNSGSSGSLSRPAFEGDVLLVDDHADNRDLIGHILARLGVRVVLAENGQEAVERAQEQDFDVILMDMQMPVMDGLDATRLLRLTGCEGTIVALTANATEEERQEALDAGCNDFLTKPIQQQRFREVLARYLRPAGGETHVKDSGLQLMDPEILDKLRHSFLQDLPVKLEEMAQALEAGELKRLASLAHQIKGVGNTFGFPEATRVAGILEIEARQGDVRTVAERLKELEAVCQTKTS